MKFTNDAKLWLSKWSTWLATVSAMSSAGMLAFGQLPDRVQDAFPDMTLVAMGSLAILCAALVPVATGLKQRNIPE